MKTSPRIDFAAIKTAALANAEGLLAEWLPDGKRQGREWIARNPCRADNKPGSFCVNLETGIWADFATGDKGSDLIALLAYLQNCEQGTAARELAARLGLRIGNLRSHKRRQRPFEAQRKPTPAPSAKTPHRPKGPPLTGTADIPADIVHPRLGAPAMSWRYNDAEGRACGFACRFEMPDGKQVLPFSWIGSKWQWKAMPEPRPLYRLPDLTARPESVVVITEGEKACEAACELLPEACVTAWAMGSKAWHKTDWRPLKGRRIILWPDADQPGTEAMTALKAHLLALPAASVTMPALPPDLPTGFDAADVQPAGLGREFALSLLAGTTATKAAIMKENPHA